MSSQGCAISARAGDCYEFAQAKRVRQVRDEQTITAAWDKLNRMMEEGKLPPPAANYTLEAIHVISNGRSAWPPSATQRSKPPVHGIER